MLRYAGNGDIPGLKKLWRECFGDKDSYIDSFFDALFAGEAVILAEENGMLCGASFFLMAALWTPQGASDIRYVYALATDPRFRGRGIAGNLLREASCRYKAPLVAQPADESLAEGFYAPLGYARDFCLECRTVCHGQGGSYLAENAGAEDYMRLRDAHFKKRYAERGYVAWPFSHIAFAIAQHRAEGGDALLVQNGADEGRCGMPDILLYYVENKGRIVVTETTLPPAGARDVLCRRLGCPPQEVVVWQYKDVRDMPKARVPEPEGAAGVEYKLTGMSDGLPVTGGYLNLTLD